MACFVGLSRYGLEVKEADVVMRAGKATQGGMPEVLVIQSKPTPSAPGGKRTLVFKDANGQCNPQAGCTCQAEPSSALLQSPDGNAGLDSLAADAAEMDGADPGSSGCYSSVCSADLPATLADAGYVRSMAGALATLPQGDAAGRRILSVGLGSGTLALALRAKFPGSRQTAVELSPEVVSAAKCFGADRPDLDIVTADGRQYIESTEDGAFDALLIDVFDGEDKVPACFTTTEFFHLVRQKLKPKGLLVMNAHSGATLHNDLKELVPGASSAFGEVRLGRSPGLANVIVLASGTSGAAAAGAPATGLLQQGAGDEELDAWFADAQFKPAGEASGAARSDADVQCGR